jgi:hypothetical protein
MRELWDKRVDELEAAGKNQIVSHVKPGFKLPHPTFFSIPFQYSLLQKAVSGWVHLSDLSSWYSWEERFLFLGRLSEGLLPG